MNTDTATRRAEPADIQWDAPEWNTRCDLAALYRLVAFFRWTDLISTHITAKVPGTQDHFLINHYGINFDEMRASDLVKIDLDGNIVDEREQGKRVNRAGYVIHSAIHGARPDLACVIHTHTAAGIAVSCQEDGLLPISQHALKFYGHLGYHGYEGIALDLDERSRLVRDLGPHKAMILRNHGLLAGGRTIPEAFDLIYFLERACQAQIAAQAGGAKLVYPPEEVRQRSAAQFHSSDGVSFHADLAWDAVLRSLPGGPTAHCC